ncbi:RICIN domain-containing protein [Streptosporangium minutum]|uniref:RICIN domain-containing protein n=1 Tax=Streptosporangium minutum TaxID=569862 RepID=UPI001054A8C9|nr:RICIN domain-containing protein [Streptosporangium minutum]
MGRPGRRRPAVAVVVAGVAALLVVIGVTAALKGALATGPPAVRTPGPVSAGSVLADGRYRMVPSHVADRGLCVGEGRERNGRTSRELAVQRPCRGLSPDTYMTAVGRDVYQIEWHHPVHGVGCLTVDQAAGGAEALIGPVNCTGAAHQRFLLERAGPRASGGFVLRPVHSNLCVGALYGVADVGAGAELAQQACTGQADQVFLFLPAPEPGAGG